MAIPILKILPFTVVFGSSSVAVTFGPFVLSEAFYVGPDRGCSLQAVPPVCDGGLDHGVIEEKEENIEANRKSVGMTAEASAKLDSLLDAEMASVLPNGQPQNVRGLVVLKSGVIVGERYRAPFGISTR